MKCPECGANIRDYNWGGGGTYEIDGKMRAYFGEASDCQNCQCEIYIDGYIEFDPDNAKVTLELYIEYFDRKLGKHVPVKLKDVIDNTPALTVIERE
jgi:hypothetical protein